MQIFVRDFYTVSGFVCITHTRLFFMPFFIKLAQSYFVCFYRLRSFFFPVFTPIHLLLYNDIMITPKKRETNGLPYLAMRYIAFSTVGAVIGRPPFYSFYYRRGGHRPPAVLFFYYRRGDSRIARPNFPLKQTTGHS